MTSQLNPDLVELLIHEFTLSVERNEANATAFDLLGKLAENLMVSDNSSTMLVERFEDLVQTLIADASTLLDEYCRRFDSVDQFQNHLALDEALKNSLKRIQDIELQEIHGLNRAPDVKEFIISD